jgi:hypothetical protein
MGVTASSGEFLRCFSQVHVPEDLEAADRAESNSLKAAFFCPARRNASCRVDALFDSAVSEPAREQLISLASLTFLIPASNLYSFLRTWTFASDCDPLHRLAPLEKTRSLAPLVCSPPTSGF